MKKPVLLILLLTIKLFSFSQNISLQVTQPDFLLVDAGPDTLIISGSSALIGGHPTALHGYGNYLYNWVPVEGLNDPTLANPLATPDQTTTYRLSVTDGGNCVGQDEITITVNSTSTRNNFFNRQIRIFPNPAINELFINIDGTSDEAELRLSDTYGNLILMKRIRFTNDWKGSLPVANLPSGYYFLSVIEFDRKVVLPVIIIR